MAHSVNKLPSGTARLEAAIESWRSVDTSRTVFLGGLPPSICKTDLMSYLTLFGKVHKLVLPKEPKTKKLKGHGKVIFNEPVSAARALEDTQHAIGESSFEIRQWVDPLTYIQQRDMKAGRKVYVKHKSVHTREVLLDYFGQFGSIEEVDMRFNFNSNRSRNFCYIIFEEESAAEVAANQQHEIVGLIVICEMCRPADAVNAIAKSLTEKDIGKIGTEATTSPAWNPASRNQIERTCSINSLTLPKVSFSKTNKISSTCQDFRAPPAQSDYHSISASQLLRTKIKKVGQSSMMSSGNLREVFGSNGNHQLEDQSIPKVGLIIKGHCAPLMGIAEGNSASWQNLSPPLRLISKLKESPSEHHRKPTSKRYPSSKRQVIEFLHRENDNLCFNQFKSGGLQQVVLGAIPVDDMQDEVRNY